MKLKNIAYTLTLFSTFFAQSYSCDLITSVPKINNRYVSNLSNKDQVCKRLTNNEDMINCEIKIECNGVSCRSVSGNTSISFKLPQLTGSDKLIKIKSPSASDDLLINFQSNSNTPIVKAIGCDNPGNGSININMNF